MSYILDALKKSERDRSLGHVPTLNTEHGYPKLGVRSRLWLVLALLILLVLLAVGIYGVIFWDRGRGANFVGVQPKAAAPSKFSNKEYPGKSSSMTVDSPAREATAVYQERPPAKANSIPSEVRLPEISKQLEENYQTIDDLEDGIRQTLPNIVVNVLSYSELSHRRFVMVNQKIYHEGQKINGQVEVVKIDREGVILRYRGREFLTTP